MWVYERVGRRCEYVGGALRAGLKSSVPFSSPPASLYIGSFCLTKRTRAREQIVSKNTIPFYLKLTKKKSKNRVRCSAGSFLVFAKIAPQRNEHGVNVKQENPKKCFENKSFKIHLKTKQFINPPQFQLSTTETY